MSNIKSVSFCIWKYFIQN